MNKLQIAHASAWGGLVGTAIALYFCLGFFGILGGILVGAAVAYVMVQPIVFARALWTELCKLPPALCERIDRVRAWYCEDPEYRRTWLFSGSLVLLSLVQLIALITLLPYAERGSAVVILTACAYAMASFLTFAIGYMFILNSAKYSNFCSRKCGRCEHERCFGDSKGSCLWCLDGVRVLFMLTPLGLPWLAVVVKRNGQVWMRTSRISISSKAAQFFEWAKEAAAHACYLVAVSLIMCVSGALLGLLWLVGVVVDGVIWGLMVKSDAILSL